MKPCSVALTLCPLLIASAGFASAGTDIRPTIKVANLSCTELEQVGGVIKAALAHELEQGRTRKLANFRAQSLAIEAQQTGEMFKGLGGWVRKKYAEHGLTGAAVPQEVVALSAEDEQVVSALSTLAEALGGMFGQAGTWGTKAATKAAERLGLLMAKKPLKGMGYAEVSRPRLGTLTVVLDKQEKAVWASVDLDDLKKEWKSNYGWESERLHLFIPLEGEPPRAQLHLARVLLKARQIHAERLASRKAASQRDKPQRKRATQEGGPSSQREGDIRLGEPFRFTQKRTGPDGPEEVTTFEITFTRVIASEEPPFPPYDPPPYSRKVPNPNNWGLDIRPPITKQYDASPAGNYPADYMARAGKKYLFVFAKVKNLGPRSGEWRTTMEEVELNNGTVQKLREHFKIRDLKSLRCELRFSSKGGSSFYGAPLARPLSIDIVWQSDTSRWSSRQADKERWLRLKAQLVEFDCVAGQSWWRVYHSLIPEDAKPVALSLVAGTRYENEMRRHPELAERICVSFEGADFRVPANEGGSHDQEVSAQEAIREDSKAQQSAGGEEAGPAVEDVGKPTAQGSSAGSSVAEDVSREVQAYIELADVYVKKGDLRRAVAYYKRVLALDPGNATAERRLKEIKKGIDQSIANRRKDTGITGSGRGNHNGFDVRDKDEPEPRSDATREDSKATPPTGGVGFIYPIKGKAGDNVRWQVTQAFGAFYAKMGGYHSGVDWSLPGSADLGKPVYAVANGVVARVSQLRGNRGHLVAIEHHAPSENRPYTIPYWKKSENGRECSYASEGVAKVYSVYVHVTPRSDIAEGRRVERGQVIGSVADIAPLSPHLHFEIRHPKARPSNDWSMVYDASAGWLSKLGGLLSGDKREASSGSQNTANWSRVRGSVTGYYRNLQKMVDAGLRDPVTFIEGNRLTRKPNAAARIGDFTAQDHHSDAKPLRPNGSRQPARRSLGEGRLPSAACPPACYSLLFTPHSAIAFTPVPRRRRVFGIRHFSFGIGPASTRSPPGRG